jgi:hypothetical protein
MESQMMLQDTLADVVLAAMGSVTRFLPGFTEKNRTAQAPHLPNHVVWSLGHVSIYIHEAAGKLDGRPMPATDFGDELGPPPGRFVLAEIGMGSHPVDDPARYPTLAKSVQVFEGACRRLADALRKADSASLERKADWAGMQIPMAVLAMRVLIHAGMHTGQIMDLRRSLGLERVIKP